MEVDHFNPKIRSTKRHKYTNLFLATAHCNNKKSDYWPTISERKCGIYIINPCEEEDYGPHIREDPKTHELVGLSPAGRYHIDICDLNAPTFVSERSTRSLVRKLFAPGGAFVNLNGKWADTSDEVKALLLMIESLIPDIPTT